MIYQFIIYDSRTDNFGIIYDNGKLEIKTDYMVSFLQSMAMLAREMDPSKGIQIEAKLGDYQLGNYVKDDLSYSVIHDLFDNEHYTRKLIKYYFPAAKVDSRPVDVIRGGSWDSSYSRSWERSSSWSDGRSSGYNFRIARTL